MVFLLKLPLLLYANVISSDFTAYTLFDKFFIFLNRSRMSSYLFGCIIITLQTLHLTHILEKHRVQNKNTFLPALFYIIYASLFNGVDAAVTPALLAQTPLMVVLEIYFDLYKSARLRQKLFNGMLVLGIAILIYLPLAYLIVVFLISIFFVKIPSLRDFLVATIASLLPLYFAFVYLYFTNQQQYFLEKLNLLIQFKTRISFEESRAELVLLCALGIIILITSAKLYANHFKNIIKTRIIQQMLFVISLFSLLILAFLLQFKYQHLSIFIIPFSYLLSHFFMGKWRFLLNEIIAITLFVSIIIIKFYTL
jgi:hypothetical protein